MNGYPNHAAEIDAEREAWLADMRKAEAQDAVTNAGTDAPEFTTGGGVIAAVVIGAVVSVAIAVFLLGCVMVKTLENGTRTARKHHQCWHCYRSIAPAETYGYQSNVYDSSAYTLKWHLDCDACATECHKLSDHIYDDEGFPPLRDEWRDSGEYENECNNWRGFYPHVVARMELTDQLRDFRK